MITQILTRTLNRKNGDSRTIQSVIEEKTTFKFTTQTKVLQHSYVHGFNSKSQLMHMTIGERLKEITNKYPDNLALISNLQNQMFTYSEFYKKSSELAASLLQLGLKKGDRVGIYSPNNYEWVMVQFAASIADLILVNINPAYQLHELQYCLNKVGVSCLILAAHHKKSDYVSMVNSLIPELKTTEKDQGNQISPIKAPQFPQLKYLVRIDDTPTQGMWNYQNLVTIANSQDLEQLERFSQHINPDDPTNIQFTSGTTGSPKGTTLSHFNILNNGYFIGERLQYNEKDKICIPVPLYHCFGMVLGNMAAINFGSTMILPSDGFNALHTMETVTQYKCTALYGVPTMFIEYFKEYEKNPKAYDVSHLRGGIMAGTLCPKILMEKTINIFNMKNTAICFGMTETSPVTFQTSPDDSIEDQTSSVGRVMPFVEAQIVNKKGKVVPVGERGEVCIRGYLNMIQYWGDRKNTSKTIDQNHWLHTGDIGVLDERGYMKIVGRIQDMIIRGGQNVFPKEVQDFLRPMKNVEDVQIVSVPDEQFGQQIFCLIKLKDPSQPFDKQSVLDFCKNEIAHYKIPQYVKVLDQFTITVTGQPQQFQMAADLMKELQENPKAFEIYAIR